MKLTQRTSEQSSNKPLNGNKKQREDLTIPVWLDATESFYRKLNRVADECGVSRYEALNRGLDVLLQEVRTQRSPLSKVVTSPNESEAFRKAMGRVSRAYWATLTPDEKRSRAQKTAKAHLE